MMLGFAAARKAVFFLTDHGGLRHNQRMSERNAGRRLLDATHRTVYRAGYFFVRRYWRLRRKRPPGVGILVWSGGRVLIVRHSYRPGLTIPGGNIKSGEDAAETAARELLEEVGIAVSPDDMRYRGKDRYSTLFDVELPEHQTPEIDHREIIEARFMTVEDATANSWFFRHLMRNDLDGETRFTEQ